MHGDLTRIILGRGHKDPERAGIRTRSHYTRKTGSGREPHSHIQGPL